MLIKQRLQRTMLIQKEFTENNVNSNGIYRELIFNNYEDLY